VTKGQPCGSPACVEQMVAQWNLGPTVRGRGRPKQTLSELDRVSGTGRKGAWHPVGIPRSLARTCAGCCTRMAESKCSRSVI